MKQGFDLLRMVSNVIESAEERVTKILRYVDNVFVLFPEIVQYCFDLPDRIRFAVKL